MDVAAYGSWPSPLSAEALAVGDVRLADVRVDGGDVLFLESRPSEGGRLALLRHRDGAVTELSPPGFNVRTRVHEYGGAAYCVRDGAVYASRFDDQRLYRLGDGEPRPVSPESDRRAGVRYADGEVTADGRWVVCVRETHGEGEPSNEIVALATDGSGQEHVLVSGRDFCSSPRLSPDGHRLAWLVWDHPAMPWDATELWVAELDDGVLHGATQVAGGPDEAVVQPGWDADGRLLYATDRSGFWNLEAVDGAGAAPGRLTELRADVGVPAWTFGDASWAQLSDGRIACAPIDRASSQLGVLDAEGFTALEAPFTYVSELRPHGDGVVFVGGTPERDLALCRWSLDGGLEVLYDPDRGLLEPADIAAPEAISFSTSDDATAHAFFYRPTNQRVRAPDGERPPLLVLSHGGPTGNTWPTFDPEIQYWTTRGFAVVDVNYRGSTGYGRAYRQALAGRWGVVDLDDCAAAAEHLAERGLVDGDRLLISGGSAGGYTTLCALTFTDRFAAGASHYGVADLAALAAETHKFESRYLDGLVGPWPEAEDIYRERSPIHHTERMSTPIILLQGLEDEVVPPAQAEMMRDAVRAKGVPVAYVAFEGEQHGFRRAENIERALESELVFYGRVLGFTPAGDLPPVAIENL